MQFEDLLIKGDALCFVVIGAGILGLSVAEYASRQGHRVVVLEDPRFFAASQAAAAQLGLKGQSVSKSDEFRLKIAGQRMYEDWIRLWGLNPVETDKVSRWFRRGWGRDHVLSRTEFAEQKRRIQKHEPEVVPPFVGPSLVYFDQQESELRYHSEAAVDAPVMLGVLRRVLERRGVTFEQKDAGEWNGILSSALNVVLAAGAWSFDILKRWGFDEGHFKSSLTKFHKRYTLGATVVYPSATMGHFKKLNFNQNVMEGFLDRSASEIVAVTSFREKYFVTSLSVDLPGGPDEACHQELSRKFAPLFKDKILQLEGLFLKHGIQVPTHHGLPELKIGIRLKATKADYILEVVHLPESFKNRIVLFAGANRSGYLYGPVLAKRVCELVEA